MKKKVLSIALAVALLAIMVTGTLAYFTAEDAVTNTFTVGSVKIEIYENDAATEDPVMAFDDPLIPVVNTDPGADENYIPKAVKVKNTGLSQAYIRTHIAIPTALVGCLHLDLEETGWVRQQDTAAAVEGVAYTVFTYDHTEAVDSGEFTAQLLKGVYLGSNVDLHEDAEGNLMFIIRDAEGVQNTNFMAHRKNADGSYTTQSVCVLVASQAIQAEGFGGATAALDAGFGQATNPWQ